MLPSIFAYFCLNLEELRANGLHTTTHKSGQPDEYHSYNLLGHSVKSGPNGYFTNFEAGADGLDMFSLPHALQKVWFGAYSFRGTNVEMGARPTGCLYRFGGAHATVTPVQNGNGNYHINGWGTDLKEIQALYLAILEGTIQPILDPSGDYQPITATVRSLARMIGKKLWTWVSAW